MLTNLTLAVDNAIPYHQSFLEYPLTLTLLIDLDNTLLGNDMETFIPAYLDALGKHLESYVPPERMVRVMMAATQKMFENNHPGSSLREVFEPNFYPKLGLIEHEVRDHFEAFYVNVFPTLQPLTEFWSDAVNLIDEAFSRDYQVGVATNPLFPLTAIEQRLGWAGFDVDNVPFNFIPSYETFHFAKPNPAYFAEFLGRLGWPDGPIVMIGDDPVPDVKGARSLGLPVFWVSDEVEQISMGHPMPTMSGSLTDIIPWLDSTHEENLLPKFTSPSAMIGILRGSPAALSGILIGTSTSRWTKRPHPTEWSLTEVACHLRDVEIEVNLPRVQTIIHENNPFVSGVDSDAWAEERAYADQDGPQALQDFITARIETLALLDSLDTGAWNRPVRHSIFGPTDLMEIVSIMAGHERLHGKQIYKVFKKQRSQ